MYCVVYSWYRLVVCLRILPRVGHGLNIYYCGLKQYLINVIVSIMNESVYIMCQVTDWILYFRSIPALISCTFHFFSDAIYHVGWCNSNVVQWYLEGALLLAILSVFMVFFSLCKQIPWWYIDINREYINKTRATSCTSPKDIGLLSVAMKASDCVSWTSPSWFMSADVHDRPVPFNSTSYACHTL